MSDNPFFFAGHAAQKAGQPLASNPHPPASAKWTSWRNGWNAAASAGMFSAPAFVIKGGANDRVQGPRRAAAAEGDVKGQLPGVAEGEINAVPDEPHELPQEHEMGGEG